MKLKIACIGLALLVVILSVGLFAVWNDLKAIQMENEGLKAQLAGASHQSEQIGQKLSAMNIQLAQSSASIKDLNEQLVGANTFGDRWWAIAHPEEFNSLEELKAWLAEDDTNSTIYIFGEGCLGSYDCDDYAYALMRNALLDGKLISMQFEKGHALNSVVIGNDIYFVEPQNDKVWLWGHRDCK